MSTSSSSLTFPNFDTLVLHGDQRFKPMNAHVWPIFQSSTFDFDNHDHARKVLTHEVDGYCYSRSNNPNTSNLEKMITQLEGGVDAVVFSSGMAATTTFIFSVVKAGDHVVVGSIVYGNTTVFANSTLKDLGVNVTTIDTSDLEATKKVITPKTRFVYFETPANPTGAITDIQALSDYGHGLNKDMIFIVDSTLSSPYNQQPLKFGADVSLHSTTKFINGHADAIGGVVVYKDAELAGKARRLRSNMGGCISPFDAWLQLRGLRTLPLRVRKHNENSRKVVDFLKDHPAVQEVLHPYIENFPHRDIALRQMRNDGLGSCFSFILKGGYDAAVKLLSSLKLISLAVSLGAVDTLIQHPASMTHSGMTEAQLKEAGLTKEMVRIAVGIEDVKDIIGDLKQALDPLIPPK